MSRIRVTLIMAGLVVALAAVALNTQAQPPRGRAWWQAEEGAASAGRTRRTWWPRRVRRTRRRFQQSDGPRQ